MPLFSLILETGNKIIYMPSILIIKTLIFLNVIRYLFIKKLILSSAAYILNTFLRKPGS